jgi:hypothetical protein
MGSPARPANSERARRYVRAGVEQRVALGQVGAVHLVAVDALGDPGDACGRADAQ